MDKYICNKCKCEFDKPIIEPACSDETLSRLVNLFWHSCPKCGSLNLGLTKHGQLLADRATKIRKIELNNNDNE